MANCGFRLVLFVGFIYAVSTKGIQYDGSTVEIVQALVDRLDTLERKVAEHPTTVEAAVETAVKTEVEALRKELESVIENLRHSHAKEIESLKAEFNKELSNLKRTCGVYEKGDEDANKHEPIRTKLPEELDELDEMDMLEELDEIDMHSDGADVKVDSKAMESLDEADEKDQSKHSNRIRRAEVESDVAFFATLSHTIGHLGQNQNVKFDNVITNIGNAYDKHSGAFRAPVSGIYSLSTTIVTDFRNTSHFGLFLNDQRLTILWLHGAENGYDGSSNNVVLHMNPNDDVSVQQLDLDKAIYGNDHCMFSGFLISQDESMASIVGK